MGRIVITSGWRYTDIDILACAIAYNELLTKEGKNPIAFLPGALNKSVTKDIRSWEFEYNKEYTSNKNDKIVIVDISDPSFITPEVNQDNIIEIYDHHFGFEKYWKKKLGNNAKIETVGSCATLIWEEYKKRGFEKEISQVSARLIVIAITSNTLNFKASVTTKRDVTAYNELKDIAKLPGNWTEKYFEEQEVSVFKDPHKEIINDTHVEKFPDSEDKLVIGQIELWDSSKFIKDYQSDIKNAMESYKEPLWFLTSPSISGGKNYIYCENDKVKKLLKDKLGAKFKKDVGTTKNLILRKEIKKIIYDY